MRTRGLVTGCALAGTAALAAFGAARVESDPALLNGIRPAANAAEADAAQAAAALQNAAAAAQSQWAAEQVMVQEDAQPLADGVVALVVKPRSGAALPATGDGRPPRERAIPSPLATHELYRMLLTDAARRHGLDPGLVMAVAWWESGWDMSKVSDTGAVGLMQIDPGTARDLGPKLLHRTLDPHDPFDNADLGAAVLKSDLDDAGGNLAVALASYYEGAGNVDPSNLDPNAQVYVTGVTALQKEFDSGQDPTHP
ncbi:MAG TPA: lytic transglycosylase domain-containing protein [Candidatus Dormibacteraeota bacterium]